MVEAFGDGGPNKGQTLAVLGEPMLRNCKKLGTITRVSLIFILHTYNPSFYLSTSQSKIKLAKLPGGIPNAKSDMIEA